MTAATTPTPATSSIRRTVVIVIAAVLALEVAFVVVTLVRRPPRGPASSSYAAGHRGARGYARILERGGHDVRRQRVPVDVERPDTSATVVVLGGDEPDEEEQDALLEFVAAGGRLVVAGGPSTDKWVGPLIGGPLFRGTPLLACQPVASVPETAGVTYVESSGQPGFSFTGPAAPVLGCNGVALAAVAAVGRGRVVVVSDEAVFQNYLLGARDNATFALAAAGGVDREVVFLEHLHGFAAPSGLLAVPSRWLLGGSVAALAGLLALLARRRPSPSAPVLEAVPPRDAHAAALAERLGAAPRGEAATAVRAAARRAIAAAAGLPHDAGDDELRDAATRLRLDPSDVRLTLDPGHTGPEDVAAAAGRVLAGAVLAAPTGGATRPRSNDG